MQFEHNSNSKCDRPGCPPAIAAPGHYRLMVALAGKGVNVTKAGVNGAAGRGCAGRERLSIQVIIKANSN